MKNFLNKNEIVGNCEYCGSAIKEKYITCHRCGAPIRQNKNILTEQNNSFPPKNRKDENIIANKSIETQQSIPMSAGRKIIYSIVPFSLSVLFVFVIAPIFSIDDGLKMVVVAMGGFMTLIMIPIMADWGINTD